MGDEKIHISLPVPDCDFGEGETNYVPIPSFDGVIHQNRNDSILKISDSCPFTVFNSNNNNNEDFDGLSINENSHFDLMISNSSLYLNSIPIMPSNLPFPYVSCETVIKILKKEIDLTNYYNNIITADCRFSYEYKAGHMMGAHNLLSFNDVLTFFKRYPPLYKNNVLVNLNSSSVNQNINNNNISKTLLIFHCELTVNRSVQWALAFRAYDRFISANCYPSLNFPDIVLMKGGYREFVNTIGSSDLTTGYYLPVDDLRVESFEMKKSQTHYKEEIQKALKHSKARRESCLLKRGNNDFYMNSALASSSDPVKHNKIMRSFSSSQPIF